MYRQTLTTWRWLSLAVIIITTQWVDSSVNLGPLETDPPSYSHYINGTCSRNVAKCNADADCVQLTNNRTYCKCLNNNTMDGYKDGEGCTKVTVFSCSGDTDCHIYAICNQSRCVCKEGFKGTGNACEDINECDNPDACPKDSTCKDILGNFTCTCYPRYHRIGNLCVFRCNVDQDCNVVAGICIDQTCKCDIGYEGDGRDNCTDINECERKTDDCSENGNCINTNGTYKCECRNGFTGNGKRCIALPTSCQDIFLNQQGAKSGAYTIDTDGPKEQTPIEVYCDMRPDMGITVIEQTGDSLQTSSTSGGNKIIAYTPAPAALKPLIEGSAFCSQTFWLECKSKWSLPEYVSWDDNLGHSHKNWGTMAQNMCPCGVLGMCENPLSPCNCDGQNDDREIDTGTVIDKSLLPVSAVFFKTSDKSAKWEINALRCAPKPIDILKNCQEIRDKLQIKYSGTHLIDVDGPDGPLEPVLVYCDMETSPKVGITVIPPSSNPDVIFKESGTQPVTYNVPQPVIDALIKGSIYCDQSFEYTCEGGKQDVSVSAGSTARQLNYLPGGITEIPGSCGCGVTASCIDNSAACNCQIDDGQTHTDIGLQINRDDLPIVAIDVDFIGNKTGVSVIGPLRCSMKQFGIEANCEKYRAQGETRSYTMLIDPDGPQIGDETNVAPFRVQCIMQDKPPMGITVVNHDSRGILEFNGGNYKEGINYRYANPDQLKALKKRCTYVQQDIKLFCKDFPQNAGSSQNTYAYFTPVNGNQDTFLSGNSTHLRCVATTGEDECPCLPKQISESNANGKKYFPVSDFDLTPSAMFLGKLDVTVGPFKCFDVAPTCNAILQVAKEMKDKGEAIPINGNYTIDPDGSGGVEAFVVKCSFPVTRTPAGPRTGSWTYTGTTPMTKCFNISYTDSYDNKLSRDQVMAMVYASHGHCTQSLYLTCNNAPITDLITYETCDGIVQNGWGGSGGKDSCACGVTGTCVGGPRSKCNCDTENGQTLEDGGIIVNNKYLPVCSVCITLNGILPEGDNPIPSRSASFRVTDLACSNHKTGISNTCMSARIGAAVTKSGTIYVATPTGSVPVYCNLQTYPPIGVFQMFPKEPTLTVPAGDEKIYEFDYSVFNMSMVPPLIDKFEYCTQDISVTCQDSALSFTAEYGWYGHTLKRQTYLTTTPNNERPQCKGHCDCFGDNTPPAGGITIDMKSPPITRIKLGTAAGERSVKVGPLECFDIKKDCYEIMMSNQMKTVFWQNKTYVIDPDGPGGYDPILAVCTFDKKNNNAVTEAIIKGQGTYTVTGTGSTPFNIPLTYKGASPEQLKQLAKNSQFCKQGIRYECIESPIQPLGKINPEAGELNGFGLADDITTIGCPCGKLGTCGTNATCRCDDKGAMGSFDQGVVTAKEQLPITSMTFGGQTSGSAVGKATVTSLECSRIPKDLPKNCQEALEQHMTEGEILVNPTNDIPPFLVYCDMSLMPGKGIARVKPGFGGGPVTSGAPTDVPYKGLTDTQLRALIDSSDYCYQPVLVDCYKTGFIKDGSFSWIGADGKQHQYWGNGNPSRKTCSCGEEEFCGGDGGKNTMELRNCNCEIGDDVWRKDGGIMRVKKDLPVRQFTYSGAGKTGAMANMTIGDLYCGMEEINLDVCAMHYDDCHEWATCKSTEGSDFVCVCNKGYQGLIKGKTINDIWANGRQCYDDNECSYGMCHWGATCNNTVGDFDCNCRSGWRKDVNDKRICNDINECEEKTYVCDLNARCENIYESYDCRCNRGYVGNGKTCDPLGMCTCFGDPHCLSFDEKWLDYMGLCEYTMARDNCSGTPNFEVIIQNWDKDLPVHDVAWVKGVLIKFKGTNIELQQHRKIRIDGVLTSSYYGHDFMVVDDGSSVVFRTNTNLKVMWNGRNGVNIYANKDYQNKLCGLCGNYNNNSDDDWMLGPSCDNRGNLTDNNNKFGTSWSVDSCVPECDKPKSPEIKCNNKEIVEARCGRILNTATSVFKDCLPKISNNVMDGLRASCLYDMCAVPTNSKDNLCQIAAQVAQECRSIGESIPVWRNSMGLRCGSTCGENMKYHLCGGMTGKKPGPVMSCLARLSGKPAYPSEFCLDGCFCEEGYYRDGDKCLPEEQCGCIHSNGINKIYMKPKEKRVLPGCGHFIECANNHLTEKRSLICDGNATCSLNEKTGIYGCHCNKGFMGSGVECSDDPCSGVDCNGDNMECRNGHCLCKMGFTADCNTCIDINECASEDQKCNKIGEMCVNTNGSYYCGCQEGFYEGDEGKCVDFDECKEGIDTCPDNSECKNTKGGYECLCCAGYSMQEDSCVSDGSGLSNAGPLPKCCSCYGPKCKEKGEVCGTDGKTYKSWKELIITACKAGKSVGKSYNGKCRSKCGDGVTCERPEEECKVVNNVAQCNCPKCEEGESNSTVDSVCTSNHIVFKSMCDYRRFSCFVGNSEIKVLSTGKNCTGRGVEGSFFNNWSPWSPCSVTCGSGHIFRTRTPIANITDNNGVRIKETVVATCYRTCTEGPCSENRCRDYEVCTDAGNTVNCKCPDCTNKGIDYVCGRVGNIVHTYINECELKKDACLKRLKPTVVQDFSCESYPEKCSKMASWGSRDVDECTSLYMDWGKCGGGCGVWAATCCTEEHTPQSVEFTCSGVKTMKMMPVVTSCKCINETITP